MKKLIIIIGLIIVFGLTSYAFVQVMMSCVAIGIKQAILKG